MERKNMVLLTVIAVATLLVAVVGATFAYFTATVTDSRTSDKGQGGTTLNTATLANTTTVANIDNQAGSFTANDIFPGHTEYAGMKISISAPGNETEKKFTIPFIYEVEENTIGTDVEYYLYRSDNALGSIKIDCQLNTNGSSLEAGTGSVQYSETCDFRNPEASTLSTWKPGTVVHPTSGGESKTPIEELTLINHGSIAAGTHDYQIIDEITASSATKDAFYYFVVEYKNTEGAQDSSATHTLKGTITVGGVKAATE